jgi:hypothetical protein
LSTIMLIDPRYIAVGSSIVLPQSFVGKVFEVGSKV